MLLFSPNLYSKGKTAILIMLFAFVIAPFSVSGKVQINVPQDDPLLQFGLKNLNVALEQNNLPESVKSLTATYSIELGEQAFTILRQQNEIRIQGGDSRGIMYGLLELAEQIRFKADLSKLSIQQRPHFKKRGLKFNIPLDARAPSYDDTGDSAQANIETVWDYSFWTAYLDGMALNRYNQLTLWNPQPFTSMTKMEGFPGLALDDVYKTEAPLTSKIGVWGEAGGVSEHVLSKLKKIKTLNIDEKIEFWRKVMSYAKDRGIDIHIITWAIYANGVQGAYGISDEIDNPNTLKFFREGVKELILTYPDLKGIGITAGERMPVDGDVKNWTREKWLWESYGLGLQDAKKVNPNRKVDFIHRFWYSGYEDIQKYWGSYPDHFSFSFKYIMARLYSSPQPSHIAEKVLPMLRENPKVKTWWNLRNDDIFVYRWGNPEYAKNFLKNIPTEVTEGIHMGSDGYVWARTSADKVIDESNELEIDKHWYRFMIWGRLAYNLELDRDFFEKQLQLRFPEAEEELLYNTWQAASEIIPAINRYQFKAGDRLFAPESSSSRETFRYVNDFQVASPMPKTGQLNARQFVKGALAGEDFRDKTTPLQLAEFMEEQARFAFAASHKLLKNADNPSTEFMSTIDDIVAFSYLGFYYSEKLRTAVALEFFEKGGHEPQQAKKARTHMAKALAFWKKYRGISEKNYHPQMLARLGMLDWSALEDEVEIEQRIVEYKLANPKQTPKSNDPENLLHISFALNYEGEKRHESLEVITPDDGEFMVEVYEADGTLINNYHSFGKGPMRWEWLQAQRKNKYYLNLKWKELNRVIKINF